MLNSVLVGSPGSTSAEEYVKTSILAILSFGHAEMGAMQAHKNASSSSTTNLAWVIRLSASLRAAR
jgi:hypothetical protein